MCIPRSNYRSHENIDSLQPLIFTVLLAYANTCQISLYGRTRHTKSTTIEIHQDTSTFVFAIPIFRYINIILDLLQSRRDTYSGQYYFTRRKPKIGNPFCKFEEEKEEEEKK